MNIEYFETIPKAIDGYAESIDEGGMDQVEIGNDVCTNHSTER
jgi:hypothetical protein